MLYGETMAILSIEDYREMEDNMEGVCLSCGAFRECCEPDAENYPCDECGENKVAGAMTALFEGVFDEG